jgi:hypothetical protein
MKLEGKRRLLLKMGVLMPLASLAPSPRPITATTTLATKCWHGQWAAHHPSHRRHGDTDLDPRPRNPRSPGIGVYFRDPGKIGIPDDGPGPTRAGVGRSVRLTR